MILSLKTFKKMCNNILETLCSLNRAYARPQSHDRQINSAICAATDFCQATGVSKPNS